MRRLVLVVLLVLLPLAACGGDGGNKNAEAADALLAVGDFPSGWTKGTPTQDGEEDEDETDFCEGINPTKDVDPKGEAEAEFQNSQSGLFVANSVALFDDEDEAKEIMGKVRTALDNCKTFTEEQGGETFSGTVTSAASPQVGDEAAAAKLTASTSGVTLNGEMVIVRQGAGLTMVLQFGIKADSTLTTSLAGKAADKLKKAAA